MPEIPAQNLVQAAPLDQATVIVHLDAIRANTSLARQQAPSALLLAMVKANAYGHGLAQVSESIAPLVDYFGVARIDEALQLRNLIKNNQCPDRSIVVFSELLCAEKLKKMKEHRLTPVIYSDKNFEAIQNISEQLELPYWLKIDTGMHRLGLQQAASPVVQNAKFCNVVATHFHSAEEAQSSSSAEQLSSFQHWVNDYFATSKPATDFSIANSATLLNHPDSAGYSAWKSNLFDGSSFNKEIIRPGIMLYRSDPLPQQSPTSKALQAAMTFAAPIIDIHHLASGEGVGYNHQWRAKKPSVVATVAAGYGDGYPRHARSGTPLFLRGCRVPLVGTVSMDMLSIDITELYQSGNTVDIGDTVELWGSSVSVDEVAMHADTISYQLFTSISSRVSRKYHTE